MGSALLTGFPLWTINLFLAGLVYFRHPRGLPNQAFAAFVLTMVGWSFCVQMVYMDATAPAGLFWGRLAFAMAALIGCNFAIFCTVFPDRKTLGSSTGSWGFLSAGTMIASLSLTPLVLQNVTITATGHIEPRYGLLYPLFTAFMLTAFGHGIWTLTRTWRVSRGRKRLQIQYLWLGLCVAICIGTTTNLIVPALIGSSRFGVYGPYFSLFLVGLTAHAIIRHRLMDIRVVVRQSITYVLSAAVAIGLIWALFIFVGEVFAFQVSSLPLPLLVGIVGATVFPPIRVVIQRLLDRYCYRVDYDYGQAIKTISQSLAGLLRIQPLCDHLTSFILTALKVEQVAVYLCRDARLLEQCSHLIAGEERSARADPLFVTSPGVIALGAHVSDAVPRDELGLWVASDEASSVADEFTRLRCEVIIPVVIEGTIAALIAVGEKLSGDPFFKHDLEFLATLGHQAGIALKRAQLHEEVTWMKEYNESILRHMKSGLVVASQDGVITVINEAATSMLGMSFQEVVGQPIETLIPCGWGGPLLDTLKEQAVYTNHEAMLIPTAKPPVPIALSTSILRGRDGGVGGAILVVHDLSQIKALEEEKRRIERLASIGAFMSGIAHEIKNPLVAIKTLAELLPEQYDDEEFRDTFTKVTLHEVNRIDTLVRRLRTLSNGSAVLLRPVSVIPPLEETLSLISGELTRRNIKVCRDYHPPLRAVQGDHDQLKQVFVNLCLNSIEAMGKDGELTLSVMSNDSLPGQPAELIIQVADTGPGIPVEHLPHIFDPFFTLKAEGTGLGLAICRGILDNHRGTISAANRAIGGGAVFTLKLPTVHGVDSYESATTRR